MPMSSILLIGNGETVSAKLLRQLTRQASAVVAADGGATKALRAGIVPDGVVGDLDSISKKDAKALRSHIHAVSSQQNTDLEKALYYVTHTFDVREVTLVGFVGDRWDFCFGNLLHLATYARKLDMTLAGDGWRIHILTRGASFPAKLKKRVSLIPLTRCSGVTLTGLKYPLFGETLPVGTTRSLSNETAAKQFSVYFSRGTLLLYREV